MAFDPSYNPIVFDEVGQTVEGRVKVRAIVVHTADDSGEFQLRTSDDAHPVDLVRAINAHDTVPSMVSGNFAGLRCAALPTGGLIYVYLE
jgi:hypothetical protein